jgi:cobalt-zinc-cadmium efflux system protein
MTGVVPAAASTVLQGLRPAPRAPDCRAALAAAALLNAAIVALEAVAGMRAGSLSLQMDGVHNLSDEMGLVLLYLAVLLPRGISRNLFRSASVLNAAGLLAVSGLLLWHAIDRLLHPVPLSGAVPIVVGLCAAAGNWGVARLLLRASAGNAAIRLAYLHNVGDVFVSLAPVVAGLLVSVSGSPAFEPLVACLIAVWLVGSTLRAVVASHEELLWPDRAECGFRRRG